MLDKKCYGFFIADPYYHMSPKCARIAKIARRHKIEIREYDSPVAAYAGKHIILCTFCAKGHLYNCGPNDTIFLTNPQKRALECICEIYARTKKSMNLNAICKMVNRTRTPVCFTFHSLKRLGLVGHIKRDGWKRAMNHSIFPTEKGIKVARMEHTDMQAPT